MTEPQVTDSLGMGRLQTVTFQPSKTSRNAELQRIFGSEPTKSIPVPTHADKSNDFIFQNYSLNTSQANTFIPLDSDLGKQLSRTTKEFIQGIDDKYDPVYSEPDPLGKRTIIGFKEKNVFERWF